jgi:predicted ATPase
MALFGAPIAHEDSPRRAVHAALNIQRAIRDVAQALQAERGLSLHMRIGVNTGLVVVGKIGDDLRMDYTAVGDTTNLAARLQQLAQPGTVLISAATQQHVAGFFETRDLGERPVKGRAPVRAFEVLRPRGRRTRFDVAVERGLTPLVGREQELATLRERFSEVKAGRGQVVGIVAEAGMGKSRLVLEFRRALAQASEAVTWIEGHCISFGQASPFLPLIEQLREPFQIDEVDGAPEIIAKVEQGMRRMGELEAHIPAICYLLSVDPGDPAFAALDGPALRRQLFAALRALSLRGARLRPLVLVVEDLHWIDTSSEAFLTAMLDAVAGVPLLLLVTYRIGYTPPFGSRSFSTTLTLHSFSETETLAMAGHVLGTAQFPTELQAALMDKAEGVPLFIEEVINTLLDLGVLRRENGEYRLVKSLSEVRVPDTIQGIIMARLDHLGDEGKGIVQLASVIGRQFLVRLLARVSGLSERLDGLLRELQALEIIYEQGLVSEPAYVFKHAVIQDVAYNSLLIQRRKALHRAVGEAIEELYQDRLEEHYAELAHHFIQGEVWDKAVTYCPQAGARAFERAAFREAMAAFEQALQALAHLPEHGDTRRLAIDLRLALARSLSALGEYGRGLTLLGEAASLSQALDDRARLGRVLTNLASERLEIGDLDNAIAAGQQAFDLAVALGESALQVRASYTLGRAYRATGDVVRSAELLRRNVEAADRESDTSSPELRLRSRASLALTLSMLGAFAEGQRHGEEALRLAMREGGGSAPIMAYGCLGLLYLAQGDLAHAIRMLEPGLALCRVSDNRDWLQVIAAGLGYAHALQGHLTEGRALLEEALSESLRAGAQGNRAFWVVRLSEVCRLAGRGEEAWQHARQALDLARQQKARGDEALALHQLGAVYVHADPPDAAQAAAHYQQALALAEELGMRPLQAHCHRGLGTLYAATGQQEQARTALSTAIAMYRDMEMTFWLPQTEAALAQVEGR